MKYIITLIGSVIAYLSAAGLGIWVIVEFILYLVKDRPFNWWSLWSLIICIIVILIALIILAMIVTSQGKTNTSGFDATNPKRSKFQQRLDEMEKERIQKIGNPDA